MRALYTAQSFEGKFAQGLGIMGEHSLKELSVAAPPYLVDPSGSLGLYWTDPPGVLVRFIRPARGTTEIAEWLTGVGLDLLAARFPVDHELRLILDMRQMVGRSATARSLLMRASATSRSRIKHVVLLPSVHLGPTYASVIEASAIVLRALGYRVHVEHDLERALKKHGTRVLLAADRKSTAPALHREPR